MLFAKPGRDSVDELADVTRLIAAHRAGHDTGIERTREQRDDPRAGPGKHR